MLYCNLFNVTCANSAMMLPTTNLYYRISFPSRVFSFFNLFVSAQSNQITIIFSFICTYTTYNTRQYVFLVLSSLIKNNGSWEKSTNFGLRLLGWSIFARNVVGVDSSAAVAMTTTERRSSFVFLSDNYYDLSIYV